MGTKQRIMAMSAISLVLTVGSAVTMTAPAQAALDNCPGTNVKAFCFYQNADFTGFTEYWPGNLDRNTCTVVTEQIAGSVWNATGTRWYLFRTTTCNGSHAEIPPGYAGALPSGYADGRTHAVMRTSTTS